MTEPDFHRIISASLILWGVLGLVLAVTPSGLLTILTRGRVTMSGREAMVSRVLGILNAYGAFHLFWFGT